MQMALTRRVLPVDVGSILRDVANRLRNDANPDVAFQIAVSKNFPAVDLMFDRVHIRMVRNCVCMRRENISPVFAASRCVSVRAQTRLNGLAPMRVTV